MTTAAKLLDNEQITQVFRDYVRGRFKNYAEAAEFFGCTRDYIASLAVGRKKMTYGDISKNILSVLGYEYVSELKIQRTRITGYRRTDASAESSTSATDSTATAKEA